jgi:hypothetical protein
MKNIKISALSRIKTLTFYDSLLIQENSKPRQNPPEGPFTQDSRLFRE